MEPHTKLQYRLPPTQKIYIGTVITTTDTELIIDPITDTSEPSTQPRTTHNLSRKHDTYRIIHAP